MRKLILAVIILLSLSSCNFLKIFQIDSFDPHHYVSWYVKNLTDETIVITKRDLSGIWIVENGDSVDFMGFSPLQSEGIPTFDSFFEFWQPDYWGEEQYLTISSADGEELKTWKYTPENAVDEPFFQESSWRFYQREYDTSSELELTWVYDLRPEDLATAAPEP